MHRLILAGLLLGTAGSATAESLWGLTFDNRIVRFDSADPEAILSDRPIVGLMPGDELIGIDLRPATGELYTLTRGGMLYTLTPTATQFTAVAGPMLTRALQGTTFGIDFNPVPDRLRVVSDTGQNLRINVATGEAAADGMIADTFAIGAVAYINNVAGATSTVLYGLDANGDTLVRSTNPNAGTYVTTNLMGQPFQPLGLSFTSANAVGFDVSGRTGVAYVNIDSLLWTVDLMSGQASSIGIVGAGPLRSIATLGVVPEPATWAMLIAGFGLVGVAARRRRTAVAA
jgi:hypothetical protein